MFSSGWFPGVWFRRRGITQKKTYNIQNTAKVWNQKYLVVLLGLLVHRISFLCYNCLWECFKWSVSRFNTNTRRGRPSRNYLKSGIGSV
jgi:hypothetical protein